DLPFTLIFLPVSASQFVIAGLDVGRFHCSDAVPVTVQIAGLLSVVGGLTVACWAMVANPFFSSVIRIQTDRGHRVVADGPYRYVRHPAYAASPFLLVGTGLALGSWLATIIGGVLVALVVRRTVAEDCTLRAHLNG